jgi:hypothetical protein
MCGLGKVIKRWFLEIVGGPPAVAHRSVGVPGTLAYLFIAFVVSHQIQLHIRMMPYSDTLGSVGGGTSDRD